MKKISGFIAVIMLFSSLTFVAMEKYCSTLSFHAGALSNKRKRIEEETGCNKRFRCDEQNQKQQSYSALMLIKNLPEDKKFFIMNHKLYEGLSVIPKNAKFFFEDDQLHGNFPGIQKDAEFCSLNDELYGYFPGKYFPKEAIFFMKNEQIYVHIPGDANCLGDKCFCQGPILSFRLPNKIFCSFLGQGAFTPVKS